MICFRETAPYSIISPICKLLGSKAGNYQFQYQKLVVSVFC